MIEFTGAARPRSPAGFARAAAIVGCSEAALRAVVAVEAAGRGFDSKGRPKMLFEPHHFYKHVPRAMKARAVADGLAYATWKAGAYPADSYPRLTRAIALDETAALLSCSWGLGQLMGSNHRAAGFASPQAMVLAFRDGEDEQLAGMAHFIVASPTMAQALRLRRWAVFARLYNGPGFRKNAYDTKLERAYAREVKGTPAASPVSATAPVLVLRKGTRGEDVRGLQRQLAALGHYRGAADGTFGPATALAVKAFQTARGLLPDGIAGAITRTALAAAQPRLAA